MSRHWTRMAGLALALLAGPAQADPPDAATTPDAMAAPADVPVPAVASPVAPAPPTPAPQVAPPAAGDEAPVVRYVLSATLDDHRHEVLGEGTLHWRNTARVPVQDLWFHLYLNGFANDHTLFMRTTGGEHRGNVHGSWGRIDVRRLLLATGEDLLADATHDPAVPDDTSQLHVRLPRPVPPGASIAITMAWTSALPGIFARTGYLDRFHMVAQWFPKVAVLEPDGRWAHFAFHGNSEFYADFGTYDVTLRVPHGWTVGASGQPAGSPVTEGSLDRHRYVARQVHDFAWTTWDRFREVHAPAGDVSLRVLHPPGEEASAQRNAAVLQRALPVFARRFGAYPYPNLTVVLPPRDADGAGGMEYPTLITTGGHWWLPDRVRMVELLAVHEFAHQYFYGLLASNEHDWPFLDEGLAEWATGLVLEELLPPRAQMIGLFGLPIEYFALAAGSSAAIRFPEPVAQGAADFPTFASYSSHVYARTATILRTAELTWGRAPVRQAVALYASRQRFQHPTPEDLLLAFRDVLGDDVVDRFLRPALFGIASVDYAIELAESHPAARAGTWSGRVVVHRSGALEIPVDIELEREDGHRLRSRWDGHGYSHVVPYSGPVPLRAARVDPWGHIPLDRYRLDNARLASRHRASLAALLTRVGYWLELALQVAGP